MQQLGWISRALCWVQKANLKISNSIWFHSYKILEVKKLQRWRSGEWLPGVRNGEGREVMSVRGSMTDGSIYWSLNGYTNLHMIKDKELDTLIIPMSISGLKITVVNKMLSLGKLDDGYRDLFILSLQLPINLNLFQNKKLRKGG